jgi:hypothetical protein
MDKFKENFKEKWLNFKQNFYHSLSCKTCKHFDKTNSWLKPGCRLRKCARISALVGHWGKLLNFMQA